MKVVIAMDSLKGSLSSVDAGKSIKEGILSVCNAQIIVKPLADGGEGTVDALLAGMGGREVQLSATGPLGDKITCTYGILDQNQTAVIEMAAAAGINLIPKEDLNPLYTTTYGVGELVRDAIFRGCRDFIIGIGGSATNDGGIGMLQALGYVFYDSEGKPVGAGGREAARIKDISSEGALQELKECRFMIACDVTNPLYGPLGASHVFGPQKGASPEIVESLDSGLEHFSQVVNRILGKDTARVPGTGAAGGLGYAFLTFLNATLESGIEIILREIGLEEDIKDADFIITGEGQLDFQTSMGKAPVGVAKLAKKYGKKVLAFAGSTTKNASKCNEEGIDAYFSILQLPMTVKEAMAYDTAKSNLFCTAAQVFRLIKAVQLS